MKFDKNFFVKQEFTQESLHRYREAVKRDLEVARTGPSAAVTFHFAYMALLKIGIYRIAREGYRAKSRPGHHQKIIETLSQILDSEEVMVLGDKMRKGRNVDLYDAGALESPEIIKRYLAFVEKIYQRIDG